MYFDCISHSSSSCSIIGKMQLLLCCNYMCWVEISTYSKICCLICLQYDLDTFPKTKYHHLQKFILTDTCNQYQVNIIIYQQYLLKQTGPEQRRHNINSLQAGWSVGIGAQWEDRFSAPIQASPGYHPPSCTEVKERVEL